MAAFITQEHLDESIPSLAEASEDQLQPFDVHQQSAFLNLGEHMDGQLEGRVVASALRFSESQIAASKGHDRVTVWPCQRDDGVVLVRVDMQMMGRRTVDVGVLDELGFHGCDNLRVVSAQCRGLLPSLALHHLCNGRKARILPRRGLLCRFRLQDLSLDLADLFTRRPLFIEGTHG